MPVWRGASDKLERETKPKDAAESIVSSLVRSSRKVKLSQEKKLARRNQTWGLHQVDHHTYTPVKLCKQRQSCGDKLGQGQGLLKLQEPKSSNELMIALCRAKDKAVIR